MPIGAAIVGAGAISAGASIYGANKAAGAQTAAGRAAIEAQERMFRQAKEAVQPWITAGTGVLPTLQSLITPGPNQNAVLAQTPGFQFAQDWGLRGIKNAATMRGLSGNVLTEGASYSSGLAQNTWQNTVNALLGLSGQGQAAGSGLAGNAVATGQGIAGSNIGIGNAQAGAAMGTANAISNFASGISNIGYLQALTGGSAFVCSGNPGMY